MTFLIIAGLAAGIYLGLKRKISSQERFRIRRSL